MSELTDLLFLKIAKETGTQAGIPEDWRRDELERLQGLKQLEHYILLLLELDWYSARQEGLGEGIQEHQDISELKGVYRFK